MKEFLLIAIILMMLAMSNKLDKSHKEEMKKLDSIYTQLQQLELVDQ